MKRDEIKLLKIETPKATSETDDLANIKRKCRPTRFDPDFLTDYTIPEDPVVYTTKGVPE